MARSYGASLHCSLFPLAVMAYSVAGVPPRSRLEFYHALDLFEHFVADAFDVFQIVN
jgi:hypothetical protein